MIEPNAVNESDPARDSLDPVMLDRLVDGELGEAERRKLLLALDHQPAGWRQCALAFLEAQSWRDLLGIAADATVSAPAESAAAKTVALENVEPAAAIDTAPLAVPAAASRRRGLPRRWLWVAEMAASFLVAFSLGLWMRGGLTTTTTNSRLPTALAPSALGAAGNGQTQMVEMVAEGAGGQIEKMQVPLVDGSRFGWWQSQPAAVMPEEVRRAVERSGWQVRQERKYFPVELPDGRRALVPIDQIEMVPAGDRGMQ